jgi:CDP-diacylglycerol--serine O-phosphatidyltransferase
MSGGKRRRLPGLSANRLIPNALTLMGLCAGVTAIRLALEGRWELAVAAVGVAMILDTLDGRIARLMGATSEFGAQLDSLADVINFGVTPALIVYLWALSDAGGLGWALALVFVMCCALRLARFNTGLGVTDPLPWAGKFFTGVPAPAGAGLVLLPMVMSFELGETILGSAGLNGVMMIGVAILMISKIPTFASKQLKVPQAYVGLVLIGVGAFAAFLVSTPWVTLSVTGLVYFASIPVSIMTLRRLRAAAGAEVSDADQTDIADQDDPDD